MKKIITILLFLPMLANAQIPAFPGCEGFGCITTGGRGGQVIYVTNLNDSGSGSFRSAVQQTVPRTVLFKVSGVIQLQSPVFISNPTQSFLTIAGQSAPGGGIIITGWDISLDSVSDIIFQHLRFRYSKRNIDSASFYDPNLPEANGDCIDMHNCSKIVIDHCSFSWSTDEMISAERSINANITVSNCILGEACYLCPHEHGNPDHARPMNFSRGADSVSIHHNFIMSSTQRNPHMAGCNVVNLQQAGCLPQSNPHPIFDVRYNTIYNWKELAIHGQSGAYVNVVGNYLMRGPGTIQNPNHEGYYGITIDDTDSTWLTIIYPSGNFNPIAPTLPDTQLVKRNTPGYGIIASTPFSTPLITATPVQQLKTDTFLSCIGALPHDIVDLNFIGDFKADTGVANGSIFMPGDPIPVPASGTPYIDTDNDGMSDSWETSVGLNPSDPLDGNGDLDGDGYTNLEEFIHYLSANLCNFTTTGIEEETSFLSNITVYPNPSSSAITISISGNSGNNYEIKIMDMYGRIIKEEIFSGKNYQTDTRNYSNGIYFYQVTEIKSGRTTNGKIIFN